MQNFKIPLINWKIDLTLTWLENCVIFKFAIQAAPIGGGAVNPLTGASFVKTYKKVHVSETTLTTKNNKRFLQQLKTGVNNSINCNNYRSKIST